MDNLANAQELTAAEEDQAVEDREKQLQELEKEMEALKGEGGAANDLAPEKPTAHERPKEDDQEPVNENGPKPMLPYSSLFCLSPTNP